MLNLIFALLCLPTLQGHPDEDQIQNQIRHKSNSSWEREFIRKGEQITVIKEKLNAPSTKTAENLQERAVLRMELVLLTRRF